MTKCKTVFLYLFIVTLIGRSLAFYEDLKEKAIEAFRNANYPKAIELLKEALKQNPDDVEIYYYLGYFTHYLCYDSFPLSGYGQDKSDEVLNYLFKAVELDPSYGNTYSFIASEYGARAFRSLVRGEIEKAISEIRFSKEKGGLPDWLIEYARNNLKTCEPNAVLFAGGDADFHPLQYLQLVENYRRDVTILPIGYLNRPSFILLMKEGIDNLLIPAPISWSEEQIYNMHPYKWKTNDIVVILTQNIRTEFNLKSNFMWTLKPDLKSETKELLSPIGAVIADIIKTNKWERPIHFSISIGPDRFYGLDTYFQLCGLNFKLLPIPTKDTEFQINRKSIETIFLNRKNYQYLPTVLMKNIPRQSNVLMNYRTCLFKLSYNYFQHDDKKMAKKILRFMEDTITEEYVPLGSFKNMINSYRKMLEK